MPDEKENKKEKLDALIKVCEKVYSNFMSWTHMFAIFDGAFFIAFWTIAKDLKWQFTTPCYIFLLLIVIALLGLIVSYCWYKSVCGYCITTDEYNKLIRKLEEDLYRNDDYRNINFLPSLKDVPSTKKYSRRFVLSLIIAWITILVFLLIFKISKIGTLIKIIRVIL